MPYDAPSQDVLATPKLKWGNGFTRLATDGWQEGLKDVFRQSLLLRRSRMDNPAIGNMKALAPKSLESSLVQIWL